jgi:hypothetical protein
MGDEAKPVGLVPKLGWFVAALLPPGAIAAFWRDFARDHLLWAVLIVAVAWGLMATGRFAAGFARDLIKRRREGWVDTADKALRRRFTRFGGRYHEHLAAGLRYIDQKGLATTGFYAPELDEVYVDVSLMLRAPGQVRGDLLADLPADATERGSITDHLDAERPAALVILGPPGSGKTTLLRHTARRICRGPKKVRRPIPILLYLRDHAAAIAAEPSTGLPDLVRATLGPLAAEEPPEWFEQHLREGRCVILLDGLDEVADDGARRAVADWVERQVALYSRNDFVISSRPKGYLAAPIEGTTVVQTRHFTDEQIVQFIDGWYLAVEREAARGASDDEVRRRAAEGAEDLRTRLRGAPALFDLTVNPLLLTMVANVHRHRQALPGSRAGLYGEICEAMLWRRQTAKKLAVEPSGEQKETVLRVLAYDMMRRKVRDLTRDEALDVLRKPVRRISRDLTPETFLADVGTSGLLHERENGVYSFAHLTFQEYLAAAHMKDKGLVGKLAAVVDDDWWRECTLLYAAKSDIGPIVEACLESGTVTALALAFDCADEGKELAPELRDRLDALLASAADPDTALEQRRLMAGVRLSRWLRQVVRTTAGSRVCIAPITNDVYDLFLQETGVQPPDRGDPGGGDAPVLGVGEEEAVTFVAWVNDLLNDQAFYRLPTSREFNEPSVRRLLAAGPAELGFWTQSPGPLWLPDGAADPRRVSGTELKQRIHADLRGRPGLFAALLYLRVEVAVTATLRLLALAREFDLDLALARMPDLATALAAALDDDLIERLGPGLDLPARRAAEAERIRRVVAGYSTGLGEDVIGDVARLLARDVVGELTAAIELTPVEVSAEPLARLRTMIAALGRDLARDRWRSARLDEMITAARKPVPGQDIRALIPELSRSTGITDPGRARREHMITAARMSDRVKMRAGVFETTFGTGLNEVLEATLTWWDSGAGRTAENLHEKFAAHLCEHIPAEADFGVDVVEAPAPPRGTWTETLRAWAETLLIRADPIIGRSGPVEAEDAAMARLLAVLLSREEFGGYAVQLLNLAAAVAWVEDRRTGRAPAVEGILLAVD